MRWLFVALSCFPTLVFTQTPMQPPQSTPTSQIAPPPDIVLIPRALIPSVEQAILHPHSVDVGDIIALLQQLDACIADNPINGVVRRIGPDQCSPVTQALAAQAQELADAKKAPVLMPVKPN
jgi:hypothetical protein